MPALRSTASPTWGERSRWMRSWRGPKRSALFLGTTAEESGLLGAVYYAENPVVPRGKTALDLNFDMVLPLGIVGLFSVRHQGFAGWRAHVRGTSI